MSVLKMKFVNIVGPIADFDRTVKSYLIDNDIHVEHAGSIVGEPDRVRNFEQDNPHDMLLKKAEDLIGKSGILISYDKACVNDKVLDIQSIDFNKISKKINEYVEQKSELAEQVSYYKKILKQLEPLGDSSVSLERLFSLKFVSFRFGKMPRDSYKKLLDFLDDTDAFFIKTSEDKDAVWGMYLVLPTKKAEIDRLFASLYFERIRISGDVVGTPKQAAKSVSQKLLELEERQLALNSEMLDYVTQQKQKLTEIYSTALYLHRCFNVRRLAVQTRDSFYIAAWAPESHIKELTYKIDSDKTVSCLLEDPQDVEKPLPPTRLKNKAVFRPFEMLVEMYGLPLYGELDPTPFFALTYTLMFGIMFGDVGQGAVLLVLGLALGKFKNMKLGYAIATAGAISIVFGFIYGSFFGNEQILEHFSLIHTTKAEDSSKLLVGAIGLGIVMIVMSIIMNIVNGVKQKNIEKFLFSHNGVAGLIFYLSVLLGAIMLLAFSTNIFSFWFVGIFIIVPLLCTLLKEPLANMVAKKDKLFHGKASEYFVEAFFETYDVLLSFATNTISFVRIGAYALAHAGMMSVVYTLANSIHFAQNIAIIIIGNIVAIGFEGLVVGIQTLRLEFYEMFGRYYVGEGKSYKSLNVVDE